MRLRLAAPLALSLLSSPLTATLGASSASAADGGSSALLAQSKKKKPVKKKKAEEDSFGAEGIEAITDTDQGVGIHREQEGVDTPYIAEVTGSTEISLLSRTIADSDADPSSDLRVAIAGSWLFILNKIELGPDIGIEYDKKSTPVTTVDGNGVPQTTTVDATSLTYSLGPLFKINFGKIDKDLLVPFVHAGISYRGTSSETGDTKSESSGFGLRVGGGLNMFVDSNVAFVPSAEFRYLTETVPGDSKLGTKDQESTATGFRLMFGIATFL